MPRGGRGHARPCLAWRLRGSTTTSPRFVSATWPPTRWWARAERAWSSSTSPRGTCSCTSGARKQARRRTSSPRLTTHASASRSSSPTPRASPRACAVPSAIMNLTTCGWCTAGTGHSNRGTRPGPLHPLVARCNRPRISRRPYREPFPRGQASRANPTRHRSAALSPLKLRAVS